MMLGFACLFGALSSTHAISYWDVDTYGNVELNQGDSKSGTFDITGVGAGKGYDATLHTITSGSITVRINEDVDSFFDYFFEFFISETAQAYVGGQIFTETFWFPVNSQFGGSLELAALIDLDADGLLSYTISAQQGDFRLVSARLDAEGITRQGPPSNVPDGGTTVAMLGLGLLALVGGRKCCLA